MLIVHPEEVMPRADIDFKPDNTVVSTLLTPADKAAVLTLTVDRATARDRADNRASVAAAAARKDNDTAATAVAPPPSEAAADPAAADPSAPAPPPAPEAAAAVPPPPQAAAGAARAAKPMARPAAPPPAARFKVVTKYNSRTVVVKRFDLTFDGPCDAETMDCPYLVHVINRVLFPRGACLGWVGRGFLRVIHCSQCHRLH
jgi:hypothetical protein